MRRYAVALALLLVSIPHAQSPQVQPGAPGAGGTLPRTGGSARSLVVEVVAGNAEEGFMPLDGAVVTLVGTQTNLAGRAVGVCDSQGRARFDSVRGPFTVTAQYDATDPDPPNETVRLAHTVYGVSPGAGRITVPLFVEEDDPDGSLGAFLQGTLSGIPMLGPGESMRIEYSTRESGPDFNLYAGVFIDDMDPTLGTYGLPIPTGEILDFALVRVGGSDLAPVEAKLRLGMGPYSGSPTQDFDYASGTPIAFTPTPASFLHPYVGVDIQHVYISLERESPDHDIEITLFQGFPGTFPSSLSVPSASQLSMLGFEPRIEVEQYEDMSEAGSSCVESLASTSLAFNLLGKPSLGISGTYSLEGAANLGLVYTEGSGAQVNTNGLNFFDIEAAGTGLPGIDVSAWLVTLAPGQISASLPPTALPMFGPGASVDVSIDTVRFDQPVDYDQLFGSQFETVLSNFIDDVESECDAVEHGSFSTVGSTLVVPVSVVRVHAPAGSGVNSPRTSSEEGTLETLYLYLDRLNEAYAQADVRFIADQRSLDDAASSIDVSGGLMDLNGWIETFPCGWPCAPNGCGEFEGLRAIVQPMLGAGRISLVPVGNLQFTKMGRATEDVVGSTVLGNCSMSPPDPCNLDCQPTGCNTMGNSGYLSFVQDDGSGQEPDTDGFVVAHEVGHQFGLCHCDLAMNSLNLMAGKCQADMMGFFCPPTPLDQPATCMLMNLTPDQIQRVRDEAASF